MPTPIESKLEQVYPRLVEIRHELHAHPELGYQEHETSRRLAGWLEQIPGLTLRRGLARGTGLLAELYTGRPGPTIALRADIDALPICEESTFDYASKNDGVMHACGHDGHMTCLLGTAMVLASQRDGLTGRVKFLFQPAEENGRGAEAMILDGVLDDPPVEAIFGLHGWSALKVGQVSSRPGPMMASTDTFQATIHGQGSHGAHPHLGRDPIIAAAHAVVALQTIISRTLDPLHSGVVTVGLLNGGTAVNIIPPTAELAGTIRALDGAVREHLRNQVEQVIRHTAAALGCRAQIELKTGYPVTCNDERMYRLVESVGREVVGADNFRPNRPPSLGGEDFAFYQQKAPGCYFFVGTCPRDRDDYPSIHTPTYDFTDAAIGVGVRMFCELALRCSRGGLAEHAG